MLDLDIEGRVTKIEHLNQGHNFGIITLELEKSNIIDYDERNKLKRFFGIIKNKEAKIAVTNISSFLKGDVFILKRTNYTIYRNEKKIEHNFYEMPSNIISPYYEINKRLKRF